MSTTLKDTVYPDSDYATVGKHCRDELTITVRETESCGHSAQAIVPRAEFLAAVAAECDVIVIPRTDLPPVERTSNSILVDDYLSSPHRPYVELNADAARQMGLRLLALAEHLDAHPPVDEAQVEALAKALADVLPPGVVPMGVLTDDHLRSLVARGVRVDGARP